MRTFIARACVWVGLVAASLSYGEAKAADFLDEDWVLNPALSNIYMQSVKDNAIFETHRSKAIEGGVNRDGVASVRIDLASLDTGLDVRDVRMRFLMFETFRFPHAEISATLDKAKLKDLATSTRVIYPLTLKLGMRGLAHEIQTSVWVTRIAEHTVSVATIEPIIVTTENVGLTKNLAKLVEVIGGTLIAPAASVTFDLVFGTGNLKPQLEAARATRMEQRAKEATVTLAADECETRMTVITQTGAIYFKTGSADLDETSAPLLNSGADITSRCPAVKIGVEGHTDSVGSKSNNQRLSELRAKAVVDYLIAKGVSVARIQSAGFGDSRPVAANDTEANRAKNRRIEFKVMKE